MGTYGYIAKVEASIDSTQRALTGHGIEYGCVGQGSGIAALNETGNGAGFNDKLASA